MVELTVLVVLSVLAVEPEDIDGEAEVGEVLVPLNNLVSGVLLPLGEVVSKRVNGWHWSVTCELGKLLLELLGIAFGAHEVELESVALRDEGGVGLLTAVGVVQEDEGLSRVHPSDGGIHGVRVTHDVGDGAVKRLAVFALLLEELSILVEEAVWVIETCLFKSEVISTLWDTIHVIGIDGKVHTNRVTLDDRRGWLFGGSGLLVMSLWDGGVRSHLFVDGLSVVRGGIVVHGSVVDSQVLGIIVEVVVVIDNDSLVAVNILDDSEWVELDFVGDLVLTANEDTVIEDLDEVLHVLLNLNLIPVDTDAGVGDRESLLLI